MVVLDNMTIFPGDRESDKGKVRLHLELTFDSTKEIEDFLWSNDLKAPPGTIPVETG